LDRDRSISAHAFIADEHEPTIHSSVSRELWDEAREAACESAQCAAKVVLEDMKTRFPDKALLQALSIVDPRFWAVQGELDFDDDDKNDLTRRLDKHITFVSEFWGRARPAVGTMSRSAPIIDARLIALQLSDFKLAMSKSQYYGLDTVSGLWRFIARNANLLQLVSEYAKLAKLSLTIPMTSVENERAFSRLNYVQSNLRNKMGEHHLNIATRISMSDKGIDDFDYAKAYDNWYGVKGRYGLHEIEATTPNVPIKSPKIPNLR
jgi:hypothetical protein